MQTVQRVLIALLLVLDVGGVRAGWEEHAVSGDASLDASLRQYGESKIAEWDNPLAASTITEAASEPAIVSGDTLLMHAVRGYTRALLDRGGWENLLMRSIHYAVGNTLLGTEVGDGVTMVVATR